MRDRHIGTAMRSLLAALAAGAVLLAATAGCGGGGAGGGSSRQGNATLQITWPTATRLIPVASNSITATFSNGGTVVASKTVQRPTTGNTSTITFTGLPATLLTLTASAFPSTDGTGTAQARASTPVNIAADQTTSVTLTMNSTIDTITVTPTTPTVAVGATQALVATALDSSGATVLISDATAEWETSDETIATVTEDGVVTGVSEGTVTITYTETESGKQGSAIVTVGEGGGTQNIVALATAYINTLTDAQEAATVVENTAANVAKWSYLSAAPATDGTNSLRNGVAYSTLTTVQKTAFTNLVQAALGTGGYNRFTQIRAAADYLGTQQSGYSGSYVYVGIVGVPTTTGNWMLQVSGHNYAMNQYYQGSILVTSTPHFAGVEPQSFTLAGTTYQPLADQKTAIVNLMSSLSSTQLNGARISGTFNDLLLGPGDDARSNFPTGTTNRGLLASNLSTTQQDLLKAAIRAWTRNSSQAATYNALYDSELDATYVAYSGSTAFTNQGDYVRIDGPHVWIEFLAKNGTVVSGIRLESIWRDRVSDYNAAYGF